MHANQIEEVFRTRENYCIRDIAVVTMAALLLQISTMSGVIKIFLSGGWPKDVLAGLPPR